ncbi:hypothetical protein K503DRAFT_794937 [Rhizopogon vinicolor AM-OR11-026]|uniref:CxC1-like cysteine cluster associated with KDZ transposases domain-containing protein n=1 Tax=Rhizopogon vinicolor AM-OR11-026 TaxID=1314800 RepID=A0A1B7MFY7_9AGAM|nr:hypothetical protein K503DRAFT_794937 [Rhizopogon vinicolor AM-OR11-026]
MTMLHSATFIANQWRRWSEDIIPCMIVPYLSYIQETSSLCHANVPGECHQYKGVCEAGCKTHSLKPWRGLFSCAPVAPLLPFVRLLFVRQSPNQTAWCDAVETFPDGMGYKLTLKNTLQCCFSNAFHWYQALIVLGWEHIATLITDAQKDSTTQPTEYLRSRCPLCFGGNDWQNGTRASPSMPDIIVCLDACFTQKRSTNPCCADSKDPPNPTPSFFLLIDDVKVMEDFVQHSRASRTEPEDDRYEEGMHVPVSVLDGCGKKWEKESTRFFTDTGLMALLCRHDCVLWIVNLTSAGEKQHYALTLLDRLFKHLPRQMTVGLLYDIGCQLEWSCRKWNLLDDSILLRISFAVAVFHAYGHQWPCQIIYHPRKCEGFGLSDGEGCEQLWSSLKQLIPPLHISGFNQCFFMLNTQIRHLNIKSLHGFGHWLHRRWIDCQTKKNEALNKLQDLDLDEDMLHAEWKAQIVHQTRPSPHKMMLLFNKVAEAITTILALEKTLESQEASIHELEMQLHGCCIPDMVEFNLQLVDARSQAALRMDEKANLAKMKKDIYLTVRLNAHAVKTCICDRLCQCKSYRATMTGECKLHPGILKLVSTYNGLCTRLQSLIQQWQAPPSAVPPHIIPRDGIFLLDVDDNIWQDVGLDDEILDPLAWLLDEAVRDGICLQLEVDQCMEEEA